MQSQTQPTIIFGSVLVIAICCALASIGVSAFTASGMLTKVSGAVLVVVPGLTGLLQYCGTFRHSHDAALLAGTCLALLVVPTLLLSAAIFIAGLTDPAARPLVFATGTGLLATGLAGGRMMIANFQWATILVDHRDTPGVARPQAWRTAIETAGFLLTVAVIGAVAATLEAAPLLEAILPVF